MFQTGGKWVLSTRDWSQETTAKEMRGGQMLTWIDQKRVEIKR